MDSVFVSGVKIMAVPRDGDGIEYELDLAHDESLGPMVEITTGEDNVWICLDAWGEIKNQIDGLFEKRELPTQPNNGE